MTRPEGEVDVTEDLARQLLADQHPDLAGLPLRLVDTGFDNVIFRLGETLGLRLPRRIEAAELIEHEQRWLPMLPGVLGLEVPVPLRLGRPGRGYPWHWLVVPWIEGEPADRAAPDDPVMTAADIAGFLLRMHRPAPAGLARNPFRGGPLARRAATFAERRAALAAHLRVDRLDALWARAVGSPTHAGPPVWLHGDLHPANLLVREGRVVAAIDFGDTCAGDPACDIGAAWLTVPPPGRPAFWAHYGSEDPHLADRAEGWAAMFALLLLEIGLGGRRPTYADVARRGLAWLGLT